MADKSRSRFWTSPSISPASSPPTFTASSNPGGGGIRHARHRHHRHSDAHRGAPRNLRPATQKGLDPLAVRYLILSDLHANWEALEAVLRESDGRYDEALCCGDLIGYGADPNPIVDWVRDTLQSLCSRQSR